MLQFTHTLIAPFAEFVETLSRIVIYLCCFIYVFPVIEYEFRTSSHLLIIELLLYMTRLVTLFILLVNIPLTTYQPFGETVKTRHAFLTKATGVPSYFAVSVLAVGLTTTTNQSNVDFNFSNVTQVEVFNVTAYLEGAIDFFTTDVFFRDELDDLVEILFVCAQNGLFFGAFVFCASNYILDVQLGRDSGESEEEADFELNKNAWYMQTWKERPETRASLGLPRGGPTLRNGFVALMAALPFFVNVLDAFTSTSPVDTNAYNSSLHVFVTSIYALLLFSISFQKVVLNYFGNDPERIYTSNLFEGILVTQLNFHVALTSSSILNEDLRTIYAFGGPCLTVLVWLATFNVDLPKIAVWSANDARNILLFNLREPQRFFRLLYSLAITGGILAACFSYYAFMGNAFELEFDSGTAVDGVRESIEGIEVIYDEAIRGVNSFLREITPCSETSQFWEEVQSLGTSNRDDVSAATTLAQLRSNEYFDVCFADAEFVRPPSDVERCQGVIDAYDKLVQQETAATSLEQPSHAADGVFFDSQFVDDEGNTAEKLGFEVLTIDSDCANKLCIAFTVTTTALFAATLIPFVNIGAAAASKAARIAWRISQMGRRMLRYARRLYAKRSKLRRFTSLVRRLAAIGTPVLKFSFATLIIFIPMVTVGLLCVLLGFFRIQREGHRELSGLKEKSRIRVLLFFIGLTSLNIVLLLGLFGIGSCANSNALQVVQGTLNNLPSRLIQARVRHGAGMLYLRTCLFTSVASSAAMSMALSASVVISFLQSLGNCFRVKRAYQYEKLYTNKKAVLSPMSVSHFLDVSSDKAHTKKRSEGVAIQLNFSVLLVFLIIPVTLLAIVSHSKESSLRWFQLRAFQDDRSADISEQIASSEIIFEAVDIMNEDVTAEERSCGLIAVATEEVFKALLDNLQKAIRPLLLSLRNLQTAAQDLLAQVRVGTVFAPINLNLPVARTSEFWIVFAAPILAVLCGVGAIGADVARRVIHTRAASLRLVVETLKRAIFILGLVAFHIDLVLYSLLSSLSTLDVPLFDIQVELGQLLANAMYSALCCIGAGASLYFSEELFWIVSSSELEYS